MLGTFLRSAALGIATGGRAFTPIAVISWASSIDTMPVERGLLSLPTNPVLARLLWLCAVGEIVADKFPFLPERTKAGSLAGRTALGGVSAAIIAFEITDSPEVAACIGGASAAAATFALLRVRLAVGRKGVPDPLIALAEDVLVILLSLNALPRRESDA